MTTPEKRDAVAARIRELWSARDRSQLTADQAFEELYGDQVDFALFHAVWQHLLAEETNVP